MSQILPAPRSLIRHPRVKSALITDHNKPLSFVTSLLTAGHKTAAVNKWLVTEPLSVAWNHRHFMSQWLGETIKDKRWTPCLFFQSESSPDIDLIKYYLAPRNIILCWLSSPHHQVFVEGVFTKNNSNFSAATTIILIISTSLSTI